MKGGYIQSIILVYRGTLEFCIWVAILEILEILGILEFCIRTLQKYRTWRFHHALFCIKITFMRTNGNSMEKSLVLLICITFWWISQILENISAFALTFTFSFSRLHFHFHWSQSENWGRGRMEDTHCLNFAN